VSHQDQSIKPYYFGVVTKVQIDEDELVGIFAAENVPNPGGDPAAPPDPGVMVGPGGC
jgi:hypothetical protein